jgi:hypothetical protein
MVLKTNSPTVYEVTPARSQSEFYLLVELALIIFAGGSVMAGNEKAP